MDTIKNIFRSYTLTEVCEFCRLAMEAAAPGGFPKGGFTVALGFSYGPVLKEALEKVMRVPYMYFYQADAGGWRVCIVHMPK
jgi:hypothetical protein